jgi:hypothetical protein
VGDVEFSWAAWTIHNRSRARQKEPSATADGSSSAQHCSADQRFDVFVTAIFGA